MNSSEVTTSLFAPDIMSHEVMPLNLDLTPYDELMTLIKNLKTDVDFLKEEHDRKRKMEGPDPDPLAKKKSKRVTTQDLHEKLIVVELDLKRYLKTIIETLKNAHFEIVEITDEKDS